MTWTVETLAEALLPENIGTGVTVEDARVIAGYVDEDGVAIKAAD